MSLTNIYIVYEWTDPITPIIYILHHQYKARQLALFSV